MTKLTDDQIKALNNVKETKARVEDALAEVDRRHQIARYDAEAPLRRAVQEADELAVPRRQIHITGLGVQDYGTLKRLLPESHQPVAEAPLVKPGSKVTLTQTDKMIAVKDTLGRIWDFFTIDFDGFISVERIGGNETMELDVAPEVMVALRQHLPDADYSSIKEA